jgi:putative transcriptional regulator
MATIKERREALGMSQSQFARALNVSVRTLQGWESGRGTKRPHMAGLVERAIAQIEAERAAQPTKPA